MTDMFTEPAALPVRAAVVRTALFFVFWLMVGGHDPVDLAVGLATAGAAAVSSLRLLPPMRTRLRFELLPAFALHFMAQSVISSVQVAWLAFRPSVAMRPGFVAYRSRLRSTEARNAFCALSSLLPGTVPTGTDETGAILIHCLDVTHPVAEQLAAEEARFRRMLGDE